MLPLFAEHPEQVDGSVSAEWFHERVFEAREQIPEWQGNVTPAEHCRDGSTSAGLETETLNGRLRYRLPPYSLRALRFVRELVEGETTVSSARPGSISHAVRLLADMTSPDRDVQVRRIDQQITELRKRRDDIASGRVRLATLRRCPPRRCRRTLRSAALSLPTAGVTEGEELVGRWLSYRARNADYERLALGYPAFRQHADVPVLCGSHHRAGSLIAAEKRASQRGGSAPRNSHRRGP